MSEGTTLKVRAQASAPAAEGLETASADRSSGGVQVIARAAAVLRALRDNPGGLTLGELSKLLGLPRSTIQRIVDALDQEQLVMAATPTRGVRLGPGLLPLAAAAKFEIVEFARPALQELSRECGETVDLSLLDGDKLVFVDQIAGSQRLKAESGVGLAFALHSSAPGKAMLAAMPQRDLDNLRPRLRLTRHTASTITSWDVLTHALAEIRSQGYSLDLEENSLGISAVAVALWLPRGELAAVSIPVPTQRFDASRHLLTQLLQERVRKLQESLGRP